MKKHTRAAVIWFVWMLQLGIGTVHVTFDDGQVIRLQGWLDRLLRKKKGTST